MAGIGTLKEQRETLSERFFKKQVLPGGSLLHYTHLYSPWKAAAE